MMKESPMLLKMELQSMELVRLLLFCHKEGKDWVSEEESRNFWPDLLKFGSEGVGGKIRWMSLHSVKSSGLSSDKFDVTVELQEGFKYLVQRLDTQGQTYHEKKEVKTTPPYLFEKLQKAIRGE